MSINIISNDLKTIASDGGRLNAIAKAIKDAILANTEAMKTASDKLADTAKAGNEQLAAIVAELQKLHDCLCKEEPVIVGIGVEHETPVERPPV